MAHFCLLAVTSGPGALAAALDRYRIEDDEQGRKPHFTFAAAPGGPPDPETGISGFWRNPDGRWDGWTLGGRWWGLLDAGHWGPEAYDEARHDVANRCTGAEIAARLLDRPDRLAEIHALLMNGHWHEVDDFASASAWRAFLRLQLTEVAPTAAIAVVDCHC